MKTSSPLMFSKNSTLDSPSAKVLMLAGTSFAKQCSAISVANFRLAFPDSIFILKVSLPPGEFYNII
jgi:hypothetical protein